MTWFRRKWARASEAARVATTYLLAEPIVGKDPGGNLGRLFLGDGSRAGGRAVAFYDELPGAPIVSGDCPTGLAMLDIATPAGYDAISIEIDSLMANGEGAGLTIRVSTDNGATYIAAAGAYQHGGFYLTQGPAALVPFGSTSATSIVAGVGIAADTSASMRILISDPDQADRKKMISGTLDAVGPASPGVGGPTALRFSGSYIGANAPITNIRIAWGGTVTWRAGRYRVRGFKG